MAFWKKIKNSDAVPVLKEELVFDTEPTMNSTNPVTSDGVARAIAGGGGQITVDQNYDPESVHAQAGTAVAQAVAGKQDTINDLSTIRSGAALGATAVQPGSLATVATSGSYNDLSDKPTIPPGVVVDQEYNASSANAQSGVAMAGALAGKQDTISDLATIRSGASAGATAVQPGTLSAVATSGAYADLSGTPNLSLKEDISNKKQSIVASSQSDYPSSKAVADFVSDAVSSNSADYISDNGEPFDSAADLPTDPSVVGNNDYAIVLDGGIYYRYKATVSGNTVTWALEYQINTSPLSPAQLNAVNSGIDSTKVGNYDNHIADTTIHVTAADKTAWSGKQDAISDLSTIRSGAALGATAVQPGSLATVATSGSYNDLSDKPTIPPGVVVDQVYDSTSANAQSGVAVASAISGKQDTINDLSTIRSGAALGATAVQPGSLATVATSGAYSDLSGKPTIPSVDQVYDGTSANAQSGVAVASAIAGISVDEVPTVTSSDDGKVLKATYSGGAGSYAWATESGGGASYTAGDGIAIDNDEISVRIKDDGVNPLKVSSSAPSGEDAYLVTPEGSPDSEGWKALGDSSYRTVSYDDSLDQTSITFRYLWNGSDPNPLAMVDGYGDYTLHFAAKLHLLWISWKESSTDIVATSNTVSDAFTVGRYVWDKGAGQAVYSLGTLVDTTEDGSYVFEVSFTVSGDHTADFNGIAFSASGVDFGGINETVSSSFLSESHVLALQGDSVYLVGETIPGGALYVEVDQNFNGGSTNPQSGNAVTEALNTVRQVPYGNISDNGKALVWVDTEGEALWADQSSASIDRDGSALEVRLRKASGVNNSGLAVATTETPTVITGTVVSGGPNSSYYATFTKAVALDPDTDTVNITGFEDSIPSGTTTPVYAIVVDGSTWQSGTLVGGPICDRMNGGGLDLSNPSPCPACVITDPSAQYATSTFFANVNTFMVFAVSNQDMSEDHGSFYGNFIQEWRDNGLYSALEQYAVALTQPSGDVEFEIPSRPAETRGLYVTNQLPSSAIGDAGKVLTVSNGGTPGWATVSASVSTDGVMAGTGTALDPVVLNYGTGLSMANSQTTNLVNITGVSTYGAQTTSFELTAQDCAAVNAAIASGLGEVSMVPSASYSLIMDSAASADNHVRFVLIDSNASTQYHGPVVATIPQGQTSVTVDSSNFSRLPLDQFHVGSVSGPALDGDTYALPAGNDYVVALVGDEYVDVYDNRSLTINFDEAGVPQLVVSNPVPSITGNAGKVLAVNSGATGTEWVAPNSYTFSTGLTTSGNTVSVTNPVPSVSGHAGQILAVNSGATGTEWVNAPSASVSATGVISGNGTSPSPLQLNYNSTLTSVNGVIPEVHTQSLSWDNDNHLSGIAVTYADYNKLKNLGYSNVKLQLVFPSTYVCALTRQGSNDDCYLHIADTTGNFKGVSGSLGNTETGYTVVPDLSNITLSSLGFTTENTLYEGTYYIWFSTNYQAVSYQDEVGTMYNVFADYNPSLGDGTATTTVVNIGATGAQLGVSVASLTTAGITDIQQVAALPASPVATVLYLIPEA